MKTSIWIESLEGNHYQVFNTAESVFETVESSRLNIHGLQIYDVIQYDANRRMLSITDLRIIYKSDNKEKSEIIIKFIQDRLYEKSQLLQEIQAIKKIKDKLIEPVVDKLKKQVHDDYFEFKICDMLNKN